MRRSGGAAAVGRAGRVCAVKAHDLAGCSSAKRAVLGALYCQLRLAQLSRARLSLPSTRAHQTLTNAGVHTIGLSLGSLWRPAARHCRRRGGLHSGHSRQAQALLAEHAAEVAPAAAACLVLGCRVQPRHTPWPAAVLLGHSLADCPLLTRAHAGLSCWSVQLAWRADGSGEVLAFLPLPEQVCLGRRRWALGWGGAQGKAGAGSQCIAARRSRQPKRQRGQECHSALRPTSGDAQLQNMSHACQNLLYGINRTQSAHTTYPHTPPPGPLLLAHPAPHW